MRRVFIDRNQLIKHLKSVCFAVMLCWSLIGVFLILWHSFMPVELQFFPTWKMNTITIYFGGLVLGFLMGYCYKDYKAISKDE